VRRMRRMRRIVLLPLGLAVLLAVSSSANAAAKRSFFLSPSGNISCELHWKDGSLGTFAYCQTRSPARSAKLRSSGSLKVCTGSKCIGDPPTNAKKLAYGTSRRVGGFRCTSRSTGMTCVRTTTGKGFRIASSGVRAVKV
jgi:hypothetical protein